MLLHSGSDVKTADPNWDYCLEVWTQVNFQQYLFCIVSPCLDHLLVGPNVWILSSHQTLFLPSTFLLHLLSWEIKYHDKKKQSFLWTVPSITTFNWCIICITISVMQTIGESPTHLPVSSLHIFPNLLSYGFSAFGGQLCDTDKDCLTNSVLMQQTFWSSGYLIMWYHNFSIDQQL